MDGRREAIRLGSVRVELRARQARVDGRDVSLTALEAGALGLLAARRGATVSREQLLAEVWGYAAGATTRAVDHTLSRLRRKLGDTPPRWITASRGGGYRLEREPRVSEGLAAAPSSFVGRAKELAATEAALDVHGVVALIGLGGIGKSRLAHRIALDWEARGAGEAVFVRLAGASSAEDVAERVLHALGYRGEDLGAALVDRAELLLVADEVETVPDTALATLIRGFGAEGGPRLLLTSQRPIQLAAPIEVGPMSRADAAALVRDRSPVAVDPADAEALAVAVDGVPFAVELAAGWLAASPASEIVDQLAALLGADGDRVGAMAATLDRSWRMLPAEARAALGYAGTFAAPFAADDLAAVAGLTADRSGRALDVLVTSGWIHRLDDRYALMGVVRQFLHERGAVSVDAADRHRQWLLAWVPGATAASRDRWDAALSARLRAAEADARVALRTEVSAPADALVLVRLLLLEDRQPIAVLLGDIAAASAVCGPHPLLVTASARVGLARGRPGDSLAELVRASEAPQDPFERAHTTNTLGQCLRTAGRTEEGAALLELSIAQFEAAGSRYGAGSARQTLMNVRFTEGRFAEAEALFDAGMRDMVVHGSPRGRGRLHIGLAWGLWRKGDRARAVAEMEAAEVLLREADDAIALSALLGLRATWAADRGDLDAAVVAAAECLAWSRLLGDQWMMVHQTLTRARIRIEQGAAAEGLELALGVFAAVDRAGHLGGIRRARWTAALAHLWMRRPSLAQALLDTVTDPARSAPDVDVDVAAAQVIARLAQGDRAGATAVLGQLRGRSGEIAREALEGRPSRRPDDTSEQRLLVGAAHLLPGR